MVKPWNASLSLEDRTTGWTGGAVVGLPVAKKIDVFVPVDAGKTESLLVKVHVQGG